MTGAETVCGRAVGLHSFRVLNCYAFKSHLFKKKKCQGAVFKLKKKLMMRTKTLSAVPLRYQGDLLPF